MNSHYYWSTREHIAIFFRLDVGAVAIGGGAHAHDFGEEAGEIVGVGNTNFVADAVEFHSCAVEQLAGIPHFKKIEVGEGRMPRPFLEYCREIRLRIS